MPLALEWLVNIFQWATCCARTGRPRATARTPVPSHTRSPARFQWMNVPRVAGLRRSTLAIAATAPDQYQTKYVIFPAILSGLTPRGISVAGRGLVEVARDDHWIMWSRPESRRAVIRTRERQAIASRSYQGEEIHARRKNGIRGTVALGLFTLASSACYADDKKDALPGPIDSISDLEDTAKIVFKLADTNNDDQISQKEAIDAG